ncbi:hypothetical protein K438DRAFT_1995756 [Mycena galopus ATCC 62051]|nr:hypothetical protein K438DRAFT_1995756 [Mycena galopus ATCC 62051]
MLYELPIGAFLVALIVLVPLPWHWRARNVPTLSIIAWLFVSSVILGATALVRGDITMTLEIGVTMALPLCCLCPCIHLQRIASVWKVRATVEQRTRRRIFNLALFWGLHQRFDLIQYFGARPTTSSSATYNFAPHLTSQSQSALTTSRYLRFMGMVLTQMLWAIFVTVANISYISSPGHLPWVSWASVHSGFSLSVGQTLCV